VIPGESRQQELLQLQKDNELSIEELRKMYGGGTTAMATDSTTTTDSSSSTTDSTTTTTDSTTTTSTSNGAIKVPVAEEEEDPKEKRIDTANGDAYTKKQFFKYYKNYEKWAVAEKANNKKNNKKNSTKNNKRAVVPTRATSRQRKQVKAFVAGPASYRVRFVVVCCGGGVLWWWCCLWWQY